MFRRWILAWLGLSVPRPTNAETVEHIEIFKRQLKRFEAELDEAMGEHRALRARMVKILERAEKGPQQPPGPTNGPPQGVTPPPPGSDRWSELAHIKASRQRAG